MNARLYLVLLFVLLIGTVVASTDAIRQRKRAALAEEDAAHLRLDLEELRIKADAASNRPATMETVVVHQPVATDSNDAAARIAELEAALRQREALAQTVTPQTTRQSGTNAPPRSREEWLEELKKSNPEEYEAYLKRREEARERLNRAFAMKADHFLKRDTSKMSEEEASAHALLVGLLDSTWKLSERLRSGELEGDERREAMMTMRGNLDQLAPLLDSERENEFFNTGREIGLSESESAQLVEHLNNVVEVTSMRSIMESMRGGGRGFGGGGGAPAGGAAGAAPPR